MKKPVKISTEGQPPLAHNPFAALSIDRLPEGSPLPESPLEREPERSARVKKGRVVLRRETAHRGGKTVVVVYDFPPDVGLEEIEALARKLRKVCGCGGTVRDREIEIQGDQPGRIRSVLEEEGFRVAGVV